MQIGVLRCPTAAMKTVPARRIGMVAPIWTEIRRPLTDLVPIARTLIVPDETALLQIAPALINPVLIDPVPIDLVQGVVIAIKPTVIVLVVDRMPTAVEDRTAQAVTLPITTQAVVKLVRTSIGKTEPSVIRSSGIDWKRFVAEGHSMTIQFVIV